MKFLQKSNTKVLLVFLILLLSRESYCQKIKEYDKYWFANLHCGGTIFYGDISRVSWPGLSFKKEDWKVAYGLNFGWQLTPVLSAYFITNNGEVSGFNQVLTDLTQHDFYFEAKYIEFTINGRIDLTNLLYQFAPDKKHPNFFIAGGFGYVHWVTYLYDLTAGSIPRSNGAGGGKGINHRTLEGIGTYGIGAKYPINKSFELEIGYSARIVSSDVLDVYSAGTHLDFLGYISIGITYKFALKLSTLRLPFIDYSRKKNYREYIPPEKKRMKYKKNR